jgi:hypothetical protein
MYVYDPITSDSGFDSAEIFLYFFPGFSQSTFHFPIREVDSFSSSGDERESGNKDQSAAKWVRSVEYRPGFFLDAFTRCRR